jgi:nephrocystin-3
MPVVDNREIRVFLSSTFRDMDAERDYLLQHVFPEFRRECAERNVGFIEIDLRWGVTEEASKNGKTVEICLSEIDRCREYPPFFIGFLGQRYGWVPEHHDLAAYWRAHADSAYAAPIRQALEQRISVTELEMQFGVFDHLGTANAVDAHFFLRAPSLTEQLAFAADAPAAAFHDEAGGKLQRLHQRMRDSRLVDLDGYTTVESFGERVRALLRDGLNRRYPANQTPSETERRTLAHARFASSRRQSYVPLPSVQAVVADALHAQRQAMPAQRERLYLSGPSGIGKSAFMAALEQWLPGQFPDALVLAHYCGADGGHDIGLWRDDLYQRIVGASPAPNQPLAGDKARWDRLADALASASQCRSGPVILLLDAIDQLNEPQQALAILAEQDWPEGVLVVVSGLPDWQPASGYRVVNLTPPTLVQRQEIIGAFTADYRKGLTPALVERLSTSPQAGSPLFLRMVLEELRVHSRHETLSDDIDTMLAIPDADALFRHLLQGWDKEFSDASHPELMSRLAAFLAVSRSGLDETELADVLAAPHDPVSAETGQPRLPAARLSPLLALIRPYLLRNEGRETLMHAALQRGALPAAVVTVRLLLLGYFLAMKPRAVGERLYQVLEMVRHAPGDGERIGWLKAVLTPLSAVYQLQAADLPLARAALAELGAVSQADNTLATQLGLSWAAQLHEWQAADAGTGPARWLGTLAARLRRARPKAKYLYQTTNWLDSLQDWAFYTTALPLAQAAVAIASAADPATTPVLPRCWQNLAQLYLGSGQLQQAAPCFAKALDSARTAWPADDPQLAPALYDAGMGLLAQGKHSEALTVVLDALALLRKSEPGISSRTANCLGLVGAIYTRLARYDEAEQALDEAVSMRRQALPPGHPEIAGGLSDLAGLYIARGQTERAVVLHEQILASLRTALPHDHPSFAASLNSLGNLYREQSRFAEAQPLLEQALALHRKALRADHPDLCSDLNNLGLLYQALGELDKAREVLGEALGIARAVELGGTGVLTSTLINAGLCDSALGLQAAAEAAISEALDIARQTLPADHPDITWAMTQLGFIYEQRGACAQAEQLQAEVLAIRRRTLPAGHTRIADSLSHLAVLYQQSARLPEAEAAMLEALTMLRAAYPGGHVDTWHALHNLGVFYLGNGNAAAAIGLLTESVALGRTLFPSGHPTILNSLLHLGFAYQQGGEPQQAELCYAEVVPLARNASAAHTDLLAQALVVLAQLYGADGRAAQAVALLDEAIAIKRIDPHGEITLAMTLQARATLHKSHGEVAHALPLCQEVLDLRRATLPPGHVDLCPSLDDLAHAFLQLGLLQQAETLYAEAMAIARANAEPGTPFMALRALNLGGVHLERGQLNKAAPLLEEALAIHRAVCTPGDPRLMLSLFKLSNLYRAQYQTGPADALSREALAMNPA